MKRLNKNKLVHVCVCCMNEKNYMRFSIHTYALTHVLSVCTISISYFFSTIFRIVINIVWFKSMTVFLVLDNQILYQYIHAWYKYRKNKFHITRSQQQVLECVLKRFIFILILDLHPTTFSSSSSSITFSSLDICLFILLLLFFSFLF